MGHFEELQQVWRAAPTQRPLAFDPRGLTESLHRFARRQLLINCAKVVLIAAELIWLIWLWGPQHRSNGRVTMLAGFACMLPALLTLVVRDWRNQIGLSQLDFSEPSLEFVRRAIERLNWLRNPFRDIFWFLMISLGCGLNLMVAGITLRDTEKGEPMTMLPRLALHAVASVFPFAIYKLGIFVRGKRCERECRSLMLQLETLQSALKERSE